jgi:hypothetical protein
LSNRCGGKNGEGFRRISGPDAKFSKFGYTEKVFTARVAMTPATHRMESSDMASLMQRVRFPGLLRGEGHEANCTVSATKVSLRGTSVSAYTRYAIDDSSMALPDGFYQLFANGEVIPLRYQGGDWLAAVPI